MTVCVSISCEMWNNRVCNLLLFILLWTDSKAYAEIYHTLAARLMSVTPLWRYEQKSGWWQWFRKFVAIYYSTVYKCINYYIIAIFLPDPCDSTIFSDWWKTKNKLSEIRNESSRHIQFAELKIYIFIVSEMMKWISRLISIQQQLKCIKCT